MTFEDQLSARLQEDIVWRIRELSEIVRSCQEARSIRRDALLRASVPVLYAHWEGYFVFASNVYLNFITEKRLMLSLLKDEFWALTVRKRYNHNQINSETNLTNFLLAVRSEKDRSFKKGIFERINGRSNLDSDVLKYCCQCIGLESDAYADYFDFIDKELLSKRNHIAHGASLRFDKSEIAPFRDKVVELMRITQSELENAAVMGAYKKV